MRAVLLSSEHAAHGRVDFAAVIMLDADCDARWLKIASVRVLASLVAGPNAGAWWARLREGVHQTGVAEVGAEDERVRLALVAIAYSEAFERGADGRLEELDAIDEFSDRDLAHAAAMHCGHVMRQAAGDQVGELFARLRSKYGLGDGGAP
jgi:hypothetical protein